jgi:predicted DCC family thiol-disulfide oxidoreductase YuxK
VCFADISDAAVPLPPGTTREQLLARFHVQGLDGELLSGAQAFLRLWAALPGWRWLALAGRLPGASWMLERTYRVFLRWRPMLQRLAARQSLLKLVSQHSSSEDEHLKLRASLRLRQ